MLHRPVKSQMLLFIMPTEALLLGTETPYHGGVDILHEDGRQLGHYRWQRQLGGECHLLSQAHVLSVLYLRYIGHRPAKLQLITYFCPHESFIAESPSFAGQCVSCGSIAHCPGGNGALRFAVGADRSGWTPSEASLPSDAEYPTEVAPSDSVISRPRHRRQPRGTQEGRRKPHRRATCTPSISTTVFRVDQCCLLGLKGGRCCTRDSCPPQLQGTRLQAQPSRKR